MARDNIRNFCIIAHIDHGKSTLSDRILELTKSVDERTMEDQILDNIGTRSDRCKECELYSSRKTSLCKCD